jgi:hypothetical protein
MGKKELRTQEISPMLLTLVYLTSARRQGAAENPVFFLYRLWLIALWTEAVYQK